MNINIIRNDIKEKNIKKFYYPSSKKLFREYQFNILKSSLQTNTLICLPTGLGKTLIASLIIYNFDKWFYGKIFFFAPTKPLISQQKKSFLKLFPFLNKKVIEINGLISNKKREELYKEKKIFFLTPQTLKNDLNMFLIEKEKISLLIFDEAHKAQKNYSYSLIVNKLYENNNVQFRIIALSASPGNSNQKIEDLINNLHIKKIEFRTEKNSDIKNYIFNKKITIIEIENNSNISKIEILINSLINNRLDIMKKYKIINDNINSKYLFINKLLQYQKNFKEKIKDFEYEIGPKMICEIYQCFNLLFQLLSCKKKLLNEGFESFKNGIKKIDNNNFFSNKNIFFEYSTAKKNLINTIEFQEIKNEIIKSENNLNTFFNQIHPKLIKLKEILINEIENIKKNNSKIIIFSEYKDSTIEIKNFLSSQIELKEINFNIFTGQNKLFKQKEQIKTINDFINGKINILISTSIAEEGLDIGDVNLIICYDFISSSPIKLIQRFGRTGRKKNGNVILLLMKGEEKSKYFNAIYRMKNLYKDLENINNCFLISEKLNYDNDRNVLLIPNFWIENCEFFDLENENEESEINESYYSDNESLDNEDFDNKKFECENKDLCKLNDEKKDNENNENINNKKYNKQKLKKNFNNDIFIKNENYFYKNIDKNNKQINIFKKSLENKIEGMNDNLENESKYNLKTSNYENKRLNKNNNLIKGQMNILDFFKNNSSYKNNQKIVNDTIKVNKIINNTIGKNYDFFPNNFETNLNEENIRKYLPFPEGIKINKKLRLSFKISKNKENNSNKFQISNIRIKKNITDSPIKIDNESFENILNEFESNKKYINEDITPKKNTEKNIKEETFITSEMIEKYFEFENTNKKSNKSSNKKNLNEICNSKIKKRNFYQFKEYI